MKTARILSAAAIVFLLAACDTGGTRITAPDQARYDGGNYFGSGNRLEPGGMGSGNAAVQGGNYFGSGTSIKSAGPNTIGSGGSSDTISVSGTNTPLAGTTEERGTNTFGSGN